MAKSGKVWGVTEIILSTPLIEIHKLAILPSARCSWHMHTAKHNCFMVLAGRMTIERRKREYDLVDKTELEVGELCTVPPGEFHRFVTGDCSAEAIEIYYPEELGVDIVREDVGGVEKNAKQGN